MKETVPRRRGLISEDRGFTIRRTTGSRNTHGCIYRHRHQVGGIQGEAPSFYQGFLRLPRLSFQYRQDHLQHLGRDTWFGARRLPHQKQSPANTRCWDSRLLVAVLSSVQPVEGKWHSLPHSVGTVEVKPMIFLSSFNALVRAVLAHKLKVIGSVLKDFLWSQVMSFRWTVNGPKILSLSNNKINLFYVFTCIYACGCLCVHAHSCGCLWMTEEGTGSPGARVTGGCKSPSVRAQN